MLVFLGESKFLFHYLLNQQLTAFLCFYSPICDYSLIYELRIFISTTKYYANFLNVNKKLKSREYLMRFILNNLA